MKKSELRRLYDQERLGIIDDALFQRCAADAYEKALSRCTYHDKGVRRWMSGGTPALCAAQSAFRRFVEAYESCRSSMIELDAVVWACHNNGTFADIFIEDAVDEYDAMQFLNELSGTVR